MSGKVENGQLVTLEPAGEKSIHVGDVVLCKVNGVQYLRLVKAISGERYQIGNNRGAKKYLWHCHTSFRLAAWQDLTILESVRGDVGNAVIRKTGCLIADGKAEPGSLDSKGLGFAPFQFAAQNLEIGFSGRLDELEQFFRTGSADEIRRLQGDTALAVESKKNGLGVSGEFQFDA
jgi:hypothetical protein